jgi:hypothetical protein
LNAETERELRRAAMCLRDDPQDLPALETVLGFVESTLRIGQHRTATARRIENERVPPCRA